ncbi:MAG: S-adenosyl-l-methionine hydroxide adenosyltransferase family protein [Acidimicrobiia bacterium]
MSGPFQTVTFLSDYGTGDEFVGVVKSVVRSLAPHAVVVDLTHEVAPFDVQGASLVLARSVQYLAPGVVLAVVDPGVGTARRAVAVEVGGGQSYLVGPDNGLLAAAVGVCGGATAAVELTDPRYRLEAPGATFAGRDVFAPAAAHLCNGVPLSELGPALDVATLLPGVIPLPRDEEGTIVAQVLWVDRFGNCQLNLGPEDVTALGSPLSVRWGDQARTAPIVAAYDDLAPGRVGLVVDSYGMLAVALARRSAAVELGLGTGTEVVLAPAEDGAAAGPDPVAVTLSARRPA